MHQTIRPYTEDPALVEKVKEGFELPFRWAPDTTSLAQALEESRQYWQKPDGAMPPGFVEALNRSLAELVQSGLEESSLQVGQKLPPFALPNAAGERVVSKELQGAGPLVVTFYRGGWCPYCNLALRGLQRILPELEQLGARLVAITPEKPDDSLTTVEKNRLTFEVLTDEGLRYARELGLVWTIPDYALEWHERYFGLYLEEHNGTGNRNELPVPATFVVHRTGVVTWWFLEADYWRRAEPSDVLQAVRIAARDPQEGTCDRTSFALSD
jgi:peroxiredoxin